jgi:hypothetical protein
MAMNIEMESELNGAKWGEPRIVSFFAELSVDLIERDGSFSHEYGVERVKHTDVDCIEGEVMFLDEDGGELFIVSYEDLEKDVEAGTIMDKGMARFVVDKIVGFVSDRF